MAQTYVFLELQILLEAASLYTLDSALRIKFLCAYLSFILIVFFAQTIFGTIYGDR